MGSTASAVSWLRALSRAQCPVTWSSHAAPVTRAPAAPPAAATASATAAKSGSVKASTGSPSNEGPAISGTWRAAFTASRSTASAASSGVRWAGLGRRARWAGEPGPSVSRRTRSSTSASSVLPIIPASCRA
jgi:hypothetical protein